MSDDEIVATIKAFILEELLPDEDPEELQADTELIETGILDSVSALKLVAFLEDEYEIEIEAHEANVDTFKCVAAIARLVARKVS